MYKQANLSFSVAAQAYGNDSTNIQFSTQDKNTAKLIFNIKEGKQPLNLVDMNGEVTLLMQDKSRFTGKVEIVKPLEGILEYTITPEQIRHYGKVVGELTLKYKDGSSVGGFRFSFKIDQALVDRDLGPVKEFYIQDLEAVKQEVQKKAEVINADIDSFKVGVDKKTSDIDKNLTAFKTDIDTRTAAVETKVNSFEADVAQTTVVQVDTAKGEHTDLDTRIKSDIGKVTMQLADEAKISQIHSFTTLPRLRRTENRKVISHLNGAVVWKSTGVTVTQPSPRECVITTPTGENSYTVQLTPTRSLTGELYNYIDLIVSSTKWSAVQSITLRLIPNKSDTASYYTKVIQRKADQSPNITGDLINNKATLFRIHKDEFASAGTPAFFGLNETSILQIQVQTTESINLTIHEGLLSSEPLAPTMLMFDDAHGSIYTHVFPLLKRLGIPATIFVITDFVGTGAYCTWEQLYEMQEAGWTVANHTATHENMMSVTLDQALYSIEKGAGELTKRGFRGGGYLALPQNAMDSTRNNYFGHSVHSMRVGMAPSGLGKIGNPIRKQTYPATLRARSAVNSDTPQFIFENDYLAAKNKGLLSCLNFHFFSTTITDTYYYNPSKFEQLINMLVNDKAIFVNYEEYSNAYLSVIEDIPGYTR